MSVRRRRLNAPYGVTVTPATPSITHPNTQQFTVAVTNVHGTTLTGITAEAGGTWSSSNPLVATVDQDGLATSVNTAKATGLLTATGLNFANNDTITIAAKVYTLQTTLTNVDGNVQIGADMDDSLQNLKDAINLTGTPGTQYATLMTLHPTVTATTLLPLSLALEAKTGGTGGNSIATTETSTAAAFGAATLLGGVNTCQIIFTGANGAVDATPAVLTVN